MSKSAIPASWERCQLTDVADVTQGQSPPGSSYNTEGHGLPFFQGKAEFGDLTPKAVKWCTAPKKVASAGDVLISVRAPVGPTNLASEDCCIGRGLAAIRPLDAIPSRYLLYYLRFSAYSLAERSTGTTFNAISGAQLRAHEVVVAPQSEQQRIVEAIESYFTRLDDAEATLERVQRNLTRYRASALQAAVEGRLVPTEAELARAEGRDYEPASVLLERILAERRGRWEEAELAKMKAKGKPPKNDKWKSKYKEPSSSQALGGFPSLPEGWAWTTVDSLVWSAGYGTSGKCLAGGSGPPVLRIPNVQDEHLSFSDLKFAVDETKLSPDGVLQPGDFLFIRTNGSKSLIGRGALVATRLPRDYYFASYLIRLRLATDELTARWFALVWHVPLVRSQLHKDAASSAGQHNVSLTSARQYFVPLPPAAEQARILAEVDGILSISDSVDASSRHAIGSVTSLRQSVLKWAFEGRIVDQNPEEEPASVLLERIRTEVTNRNVATQVRKRRVGTKR